MNKKIHTAPELMALISEMGFLPLLDSGIVGYSAEDMVDEECRYVVFPDGGWDWPLWKWKGPVVSDMPCAYGKFFNGKAGFVSLEWWPDLLNYRRSVSPTPKDDSIEGVILDTLRMCESAITRDLRKECGFVGPRMRSKFDGYITRLQMSCHIVTENFVYPRDRHGNEYGWGWSLLTTPERLFGHDVCKCGRTPKDSYQRMFKHLSSLLPHATERQIKKLIG